MDAYQHTDRDGDRIYITVQYESIFIELLKRDSALSGVVVYMESKEIKKLRKFLKEALVFINNNDET